MDPIRENLAKKKKPSAKRADGKKEKTKKQKSWHSGILGFWDFLGFSSRACVLNLLKARIQNPEPRTKQWKSVNVRYAFWDFRISSPAGGGRACVLKLLKSEAMLGFRTQNPERNKIR